MNERIQQLIAQATHVVEPDDPDYRHEIFNKELFAQLIIEECAKFLDEKSDHDNFVAKVAPLLAKPKT